MTERDCVRARERELEGFRESARARGIVSEIYCARETLTRERVREGFREKSREGFRERALERHWRESESERKGL